jgi:hypothetical protein
MRWIVLFLVWSVNFLSAESLTLQLKSGWNLVGIHAALTLSDLKQQLGEENLLVIQGPERVYKKAYLEQTQLQGLNDFYIFEPGKGYWIKLQHEENLTYTVQPNHQPTQTVTLESGWNLIGALSGLTLTELVQQVGYENLLIVQGENATYQKSYNEGGHQSVNNFDNFTLGKGYWVKVQQNAGVTFVFNINKVAVDNLGNAVSKTIEIQGKSYTVKVLTNTEPVQENSPGTIALVGTINDAESGSLLMINNTYALNSHFVVQVSQNGQEIARSDHITYTSSPIHFGSITFTVPKEDDNTTDDTLFEGIKVFATPLQQSQYGLPSLTSEEFNSLDRDAQRMVANKLLSLLFYGMPKTELDALLDSGNFLSTIQHQLSLPNSDRYSVESIIEGKQYSWRANERNKEKILSRLLNLKLGKHYFTRWSAYVLSQTILFSPANDLETVGAADILNVYNRLVMLMDDSYSMQMITYLHTTSDDNWKRFRSPEDNGREMLEIFLLDFNDSNVPKAAITLKNWRLDRSEKELVIGLGQNDVPQDLFGTKVTTGFQFYQELVKSPDFLKGVVSRLVNFYFFEASSAKKQSIITSIVSSQPERFEDILLQIIFSKEFLLHTTRVKTVEEATLSMAKRIFFFESMHFTQYLRRSMEAMHQSSLSYKLGRSDAVPTDTLSFASYYDFMRRYIMGDVKGNVLNDWDGGWQQAFILKSIPNTNTVEGLIVHLFLTVVSRQPTEQEMTLLKEYAMTDARGTYDDMSNYNDRQGVTEIVMEYLSRLSEVYRFQTVQE